MQRLTFTHSKLRLYHIRGLRLLVMVQKYDELNKFKIRVKALKENNFGLVPIK